MLSLGWGVPLHLLAEKYLGLDPLPPSAPIVAVRAVTPVKSIELPSNVSVPGFEEQRTASGTWLWDPERTSRIDKKKEYKLPQK